MRLTLVETELVELFRARIRIRRAIEEIRKIDPMASFLDPLLSSSSSFSLSFLSCFLFQNSEIPFLSPHFLFIEAFRVCWKNLAAITTATCGRAGLVAVLTGMPGLFHRELHRELRSR